VKIKLIIVALLAVVGLQGSDRGGDLKNEQALQKALIHCIKSKSPMYTDKVFEGNKGLRPVVVCNLQNLTDQPYDLIKDTVNNQCKEINERYAAIMNFCLNSGARKIIKNVDGDEWLEGSIDHERSTVCAIYNVKSDDKDTRLDEIKELLKKNKNTPVLMVTTDFQDAFYLSKQLEDYDNAISVDFFGDRPPYTVSDFCRDYWQNIVGVSLTALLASIYYYKLVR